MKKAKIYLVGEEEDRLTPMEETEYASEDILQVLLARYPDLIPGDQINPENPRQWLLVSREMGVPGDKDETGRWSLDHLFLDQDGIPTFVECKRSADTRNRREVVAQMLDYAAIGIEYWAMDRLRQAAVETAQRQEKSLDDEILDLINGEEQEDVDRFWELVESHLRAGKVRLIFAADETPKELRRLVEFLNEKMADVEVLAVEIKQYIGEGQKAVVPRVIGLTEAVRGKKSSPTSRHITRQEMLGNCTPEAAKVFQRVLDKAIAQGHNIYWGTVGFSARVHLPKEDRYVSYIYGYPPAKFEFYFGHMPMPEEEQAALRKELLAFRVFAEAGEKTLRAILEGETLSKIEEVHDFILSRVQEIHIRY